MNRTQFTRLGLAVLVFGSVGFIVGCEETFSPFDPSPAANPFNPPVDANRLVVDAGADQFATEEETLTLEAEASGGTPPYIYRWNVEVVPDDPEELLDGAIPNLADNTEPAIDTAPFEIGMYVYRIRVTDSAGRTASDFVAIDVGPTPLRVTIEEAPEDEDEALMASTAEPLTLTANANMTGDFSFTWTQMSGPEVELDGADERVVVVTAAEPGEVVLQILVNNNEMIQQARATVRIIFELGNAFLVNIEAPDLLLVGDRETLTANITNPNVDPASLDYEWVVVKGSGVVLDNENAQTAGVTGSSLLTITLGVTASGMVNGTAQEASDEIELVVLPDLLPRFVMRVTSENEGVSGSIVFEFDARAAPKTVANLVNYIDSTFYFNTFWHRLALDTDDEPFVAQFGGFRRSGDEIARIEGLRDPVVSENETTIGNTEGTLGLALLGSDLNSGTSQIFVNMKDNSFLDENGFTAFGRVVEGFDLVEAMFNAETDTLEVVEDGTSLFDAPAEDITILSFRREQLSAGGGDDDRDGSATLLGIGAPK